MKLFLKHWYLCAGLIGLSITINAQEVNLKGKVIDEQGNPVTEAQLTLRNLQYSCSTDINGYYLLDMSSSSNKDFAAKNNNGFIGIRRKFLQLGSYYDASIMVFSINGVLLKKIDVEKQNRIPIEKLIPSFVNSQAVIISILAGGKRTNLKVVKCGQIWLLNDHTSIKSSRNAINKFAAVAAVDTLVVKKNGKQTVSVPITDLVDTLSDITLYDTISQSDQGMIGDVKFSESSKTFKASFSVTMSTTIANAEIRYTTNGSLPTASSTLYNGNTISISQTTQLRAAAFVSGTISGKSSTAIYIFRNFDYTSDVPIIIMEGYGGGKPEDKYNFIDLAFMTFEPVNGVASLDNEPTLATRAGYHLRGQSSMTMFEQAPYRIELWDNDNKDTDYPVLGMPEGSDWALISPCTDNTLIRNVFAFDLGKALGLATVQYRFAEVFINQNGGHLERADYEGVYALIQPIKNRKTTLNLKQLKPDVTDPAKLSGGYIFKFDWAVTDSGMIKLECTGAKKMANGTGGGFFPTPVDPSATCYDGLELVDPSEPNQQQISWITSYVQEFHNSLHTNPVGDWKSYIDMNSFVNMHVLNEVTRDIDAWIRSHYIYKERNQPMVAGPVWDYNFSLGNYSTDLEGWHVEEQRLGSNDWHTQMWKQPEFKSAVKARYNELRKTLLADASIDKLIDDVRKPIINIGQRNFEAWPMGKCSSMGGFFGSDNDATWTGQIESLKTWTKSRLRNLDQSVSTLP